MPFNLFGSAIGSMINAYSTDRTNQMNRQIAQEQMQWQQQENERAFQRDLQMWDMQNQYNSPAAQRQRIEAAGGNAMLAFGNGVNVSSGNATNAPSLQPAKAITPHLTPYQGWNLGTNTLLDNLMRMKLFKGQQDLQAAEVGLKEQEGRRLGLLNDILSGTKEYQIEQAKESARNLKNQNDYFEETKETAKSILTNEMNLKAGEVAMITHELNRIANATTLQQFEINVAKILSDENYVIFKNIVMPLLEWGLTGVMEYRRWRR